MGCCVSNNPRRKVTVGLGTKFAILSFLMLVSCNAHVMILEVSSYGKFQYDEEGFTTSPAEKQKPAKWYVIDCQNPKDPINERVWNCYAESVGDSKHGHYNAMKELDILRPNWNAGKFKNDGKPYYWESGKPSVIMLTKPLMKSYVFSQWKIRKNKVNDTWEERRTVTRGKAGFPQWLEEILTCTPGTKKFNLKNCFKNGPIPVIA